jgi:hypothetical protein
MYSCADCLEHRMNNIASYNSRTCNKCYDWEDKEIKFEVPLGYPADEKKKVLKTRKLTFSGMKDAAVKSYDKLKKKNWTADEVRKYLKVEGFNGSLIEKVIAAVENTNVNLMDILPPVWFTRCELASHIDTIMHLIVLGLSQTVGMVIKQFLTSKGKYASFHNFNNQLVNVRELSLDWCKTWSFGSQKTPFGPWVSENTLAYVRIFKSLYGVIELLVLKPKDKEELDSVMFLVCSWYALFARIFQEEVTEISIRDTERHIKIFLSALHDVEKCYMVDDSKKYKNETTSNLGGLRNLPHFMREYGPLRLYWEGGYKGEGLLRYVKPMITQGTYKRTFSENAIQRYYKDRFFQTLFNLDLRQDTKEDEKEELRYTKFRTYPSMEYAHRCMTSGEFGGAISLIILKSGEICVSCKENREHKVFLFETDDKKGIFYYESWATYATLGVSPQQHTKKELLDSSIVRSYGLALPVPMESDDNMFYIITDNWKERTYTGNKEEYILPKVFDCKY